MDKCTRRGFKLGEMVARPFNMPFRFPLRTKKRNNCAHKHTVTTMSPHPVSKYSLMILQARGEME